MSTKYYRDSNNNYLGGFDGANPPAGSIEVPFAPRDARSKWNTSNQNWDAPVIPKAEVISQELVKQGYTLEERVSALEAYVLKNERTVAEAIQAIKDVENAK